MENLKSAQRNKSGSTVHQRPSFVIKGLMTSTFGVLNYVLVHFFFPQGKLYFSRSGVQTYTKCGPTIMMCDFYSDFLISSGNVMSFYVQTDQVNNMFCLINNVIQIANH
jgi:hypothetical protein